MKRTTPLKRKTGLAARKGLTRSEPLAKRPSVERVREASRRSRASAHRRRRTREAEPGYAEWHAPHRGDCEVCGRPGPLERHHAVLEQVIRRHRGDPWDLRWAIELGKRCDCHEKHHSRGVNDRRIDFRYVPRPAVDLAIQTIGLGPAEIYFQRRYRNAPNQLTEGRTDGGE